MPAGLDKASPTVLARWKADRYRFAPYQYQDYNGFVDSAGWRPLTALEREVRLGFAPHHTRSAMPKQQSKREPVALEDRRQRSKQRQRAQDSAGASLTRMRMRRPRARRRV